MNSRDELKEIARYLDSVRALYPGGVPEALVRAPTPAAAGQRIIFIAGIFPEADRDYVCNFTGPGGELLAAAVAKGLKLGQSEVGFITVLKGGEGEEPTLRARRKAEIIEVLATRRPTLVVLLGALAAETFLPECAFTEIRGSWQVIEGLPAMVTHDLNDVLKAQQLKKEFWVDLQQILARL